MPNPDPPRRSLSMGYASLHTMTGLSIRTLRHLVATEQIPHVRYSKGVVRFDEAEIEEWLAPRRRGVNAKKAA